MIYVFIGIWRKGGAVWISGGAVGSGVIPPPKTTPLHAPVDLGNSDAPLSNEGRLARLCLILSSQN